jgi:hypothetical protein
MKLKFLLPLGVLAITLSSTAVLAQQQQRQGGGCKIQRRLNHQPGYNQDAISGCPASLRINYGRNVFTGNTHNHRGADFAFPVNNPSPTYTLDGKAIRPTIVRPK